MEDFKELEEITEPDIRSRSWVLRDKKTGREWKIRLDDLHTDLKSLRLNAAVPEVVEELFITAKHLRLYSWFVWRFHPVSQMQAYATLELALRLRLGYSDGEKGPALKTLIQKAVKKGLLLDEKFTDAPDLPDGKRYVDRLVEDIPYFRNLLAHGSDFLIPDMHQFQIVADAINQLYPDKKSAGGELAEADKK